MIVFDEKCLDIKNSIKCGKKMRHATCVINLYRALSCSLLEAVTALAEAEERNEIRLSLSSASYLGFIENFFISIYNLG